ncbi:MAG: twin-arginine translocation signal domain-containing protein [Deltaproteobacteria bacterium]|nr:twin-arginine translocation signal domain-containing protein [Deltaproteobacteria bacterium]
MRSTSDGRAAFSRRDFLRGAALGTGALLAGCGPTASPCTPAPSADGARFEWGTTTRLPLLEVTGTPYEIGRAAGAGFAAEIRGGFADRTAWFRDLKTFADSLPKTVEETFIAAAKKHTPTAWDDLRGLAEGSGVPLRDLLLLNLNSEVEALRAQKPRATCEASSGCSTVVLNHGGRVLVCHNEDGHAAYLGRMFMLRARPAGKPSYLCASYPGVLPGNAPWINDRGVLMTTNFIHAKEVKVGVGRYFLDREAMGAASVDEALRISRHPDRAYAFHHVVASTRDRRVVSLEVTPSRESLVEITGLFLHTNHLVHPAMTGEPQDEQYVGTSSLSRMKVLTAWKASLPDPTAVTPEQIVGVLASHERRPYSPCRHPVGEIRGATLLTAVFDVGERLMRIYRDQPCLGRGAYYEDPSVPVLGNPIPKR